MSAIARGDLKPADLKVSDDGLKLVLEGGFEFGTAIALRDALARYPGLKLIELYSPGGLAIEGQAVGRLIAERRLDTVVTRACASACVTAFAGGDRRYLADGAYLGLHAASPAVFDWTPDVTAIHMRFMKERGVNTWLIEQEQDTPFEDLWVPSSMVLLKSGLVTNMLPEGAGSEVSR